MVKTLLIVVLNLGFLLGIGAQNSTCGTQVIPPHTPPAGVLRVVGGKESLPHSWPWMVLLRFRTQAITCGGSLVRGSDGKLVVITAAHCIDGHSYNTIDWKVDVGLHSRSAQEQSQKEYSVKDIIIHPKFSIQFLEDDIAMLKLTPDVEENDYVQPICLTTTDSNTMVGKQCVVAGWGSDYQGGQPVDRLHEVYKPILSDADCSTALGVFGYNETAMLCAGNLAQGGVDACSWDSGVPYACRRSDGHWEMVGVSSWGYGCAQPGFPGVYTEVFYFTQWILDNTVSS